MALSYLCDRLQVYVLTKHCLRVAGRVPMVIISSRRLVFISMNGTVQQNFVSVSLSAGRHCVVASSWPISRKVFLILCSVFHFFFSKNGLVPIFCIFLLLERVIFFCVGSTIRCWHLLHMLALAIV